MIYSDWSKQIFEKKIGGQAQNEVFPHFFEFGSYIFLEIEDDDSLRQYLTSIRRKIHWKILGVQN